MAEMEGDSALQIKAPSALQVSGRARLKLEEGIDDSTSVRSVRRPREEVSPSLSSKFSKPTPDVVSQSPSSQKSEDGVLKLPYKLRITILFESAPVWLLSLTREYISEISFPQVSSFSGLRDLLVVNKAPIHIYDSMVNVLGRGLFKFGNGNPTGDLCLVSGNVAFLFKMAGIDNVKTLFITDHYYDPRRIPKGPITLSRLAHKTVGGCTTFGVLYGKNFTSNQNFEFTTLRRTLKDFIDYGIPPDYTLLGPGRYLNSETLMPHFCTDVVVKYNTRFSRTGIGFRKLQHKELLHIYGLPPELLHAVSAMNLRNLIPVDILQAILRCTLRNFPSHVPSNTSNLTFPSEHVPSTSTFLHGLRQHLPHLWCAQTVKTTASTKNDDAETNVDLWNLRILPLFSKSTVGHLTIIRAFLKRIYNKRLLGSYKTYLWKRYNHVFTSFLLERGCHVDHDLVHNYGGVPLRFLRRSGPVMPYTRICTVI